MLEKIIDIAKEAGKILMKYYSQELEVSTKKDDYDFVTKADIEADEYIRKRLKKEFPNDEILSEENTDIPVDYSGRVWMVDPLDGTKDFINKGSGFSVMIGLCEDGKPTLGVVYAPSRNLLYYAEKGKGAYMEQKGKHSKLKVSEIKELSESRLVIRIKHGEERESDKFTNSLEVKEKIPESSVGLKLGKIALGEAELQIGSNFRASKWDTCAPQIILEEAGGIMTDFKGNKLDYKQKALNWDPLYVAANCKTIHQEIIEKLQND